MPSDQAMEDKSKCFCFEFKWAQNLDLKDLQFAHHNKEKAWIFKTYLKNYIVLIELFKDLELLKILNFPQRSFKTF